jgi:flagellar L-ring protein precursor FlgH
MMTGNRLLWIGSARTIALATGLASAMALVAGPAFAQAPAPKRDDYDQVLERDLQAARAVPSTPDNSWAAGLFADLRARRVNDLVTVRVVENISASGSAESALDKNSSGSASVTKLFGLDTKFPGFLDPTSLAAMGANSTFSGSGSTNRNGSLTAVITTRVVEVLPNNDLVLEGIREVDINGDRQFIVLSGIVRAADIGPGNVVPSTAVGQMQIRYFGKGLIKDNLKPGWLVRILNKVF